MNETDERELNGRLGRWAGFKDGLDHWVFPDGSGNHYMPSPPLSSSGN